MKNIKVLVLVTTLVLGSFFYNLEPFICHCKEFFVALANIPLLYKIQFFFGVGNIRIVQTRDTVVYSVIKIKCFTNVIIPHFLKYPLRTQKQSDFQKTNIFSQKRYFSLMVNSSLRNKNLNSWSAPWSLKYNGNGALFNYSTSSNVNPVVSYSNADTLKLQIIKENRRKSGIYCWTNLINGKIYVGSSVNLGERFYRYYKIDFLMEVLKRSRSKIYSSILKNGYSNFQLDILEYCNKEDLLKREQYFIDLLKPGYNILNSASSSLGLKHTAETKKKNEWISTWSNFFKRNVS